MKVVAWLRNGNAKAVVRLSTRLQNVPMELTGTLDPNVKWPVKLIFRGEERVIQISEATCVLEAAEKIWRDAPSSCRNGVCTTCAGQIKEGKESIQLAIHGLGKPQIEANYICTCQSYIIGEGAVIELDKYDECYESQYGQFEQSYGDLQFTDEAKREKPKKGFFNF
jgi:ferredoxin